MPDILRVAVRHCGPDNCEVTVCGELDLATSPHLRDVLHQAVTTCPRTTVNLSGLRFCDCTGLGALLAAARLAKTHGTELRLRAVPHTLARLLRLSHTSGAFTIEQTTDTPQ